MPQIWRVRLAAAAVTAAAAAGPAAAQTPDLPEGLGGQAGTSEKANGSGPDLPEGLDGGGGQPGGGPDLPEGLGGGGDSGDGNGPALPEGLGGDGAPTAGGDDGGADGEREKTGPLAGILSGWRLGGYVDTRVGTRFVDDKAGQERFALAETRAELKALRSWSDVTVTLTGHVIGDAVADEHTPDLQDGSGAFDLREASILWRATPFMDVKLGRQILTWGTGDFVFLNDLFPKHWESFFIGRRDTLLKAPSDAAKVSLYSDVANLNVVYTPQFDPDRHITGDRVSYYNPFARDIVGDERTLDTDQPDDVFDDDEWAARLYRNIGRYEVALYGYDGFWKSPQGLRPSTQEVTFPRLRVGGWSVQGPVPRLGGIGSVEFAYYDSKDDRDGDDPFIPNSEARLLFGWDREVGKNLTLGLQYKRTQRLNHDTLVANTPPGAPVTEEVRHLVTGKLTKSWPAEQITATMFTFYSPSAGTYYLRPRLSWSPNDTLTIETGINWFIGDSPTTRFGQLDQNDNIFVGLRYGF